MREHGVAPLAGRDHAAKGARQPPITNRNRTEEEVSEELNRKRTYITELEAYFRLPEGITAPISTLLRDNGLVTEDDRGGE